MTRVRYRRPRGEFEAAPWLRHGDHPNVVPYQKGQPLALDTVMRCCERPLRDHGYIPARTLHLISPAAGFVCPGSWVLTNESGMSSACTHEDYRERFEAIQGGDS